MVRTATPTLPEVESRQSEIVDASVRTFSVAVIGLGTAGSWTVPLLLKLGVGKVDIWDNDEVDYANASCQMYGTGDVGVAKPTALERLLLIMQDDLHMGQQLGLHTEKFVAPDSVPPTVVVSCVDNWTGRRAALEWAQRGSRLFIEARMVSRYRIVHAIDPSIPADVEWLIGTFGEDGKGAQIPCGMRGTAFLGASVGAEVAACVANLANGEPIPRELPYHLGVHQPITLAD